MGLEKSIEKYGKNNVYLFCEKPQSCVDHGTMQYYYYYYQQVRTEKK